MSARFCRKPAKDRKHIKRRAFLSAKKQIEKSSPRIPTWILGRKDAKSFHKLFRAAVWEGPLRDSFDCLIRLF